MTGTTIICASRAPMNSTSIPADSSAVRCSFRSRNSIISGTSCSSLQGTNTITRFSKRISRRSRHGCRRWPNAKGTSARHRWTLNFAARVRTATPTPTPFCRYAMSNAAGVALVNWFPQPNADPFTNPFGYNYIKQLQQTQNGGIFRATLQYNINSNNNLFFVYGLQREVDEDPVDLGYFPTGSVPYPGQISTGDVSNVVSARYDHFFGASVTNEFLGALSFVSLPGKMGDPTAVDRFDIPGNGGLGFNYLGMYKNNNDFAVPAISSGGSNGYPNLLMPGGFYNNRIHTKKVDPILQDNVSWQLKNHFLQFGAYWETGTFNGTADTGAYPQGEYTFNPGNGYFEYSQTNQAPYNGCENPDPAGNLRYSGAAYLGSCYNPTAMMYEGYTDSFTQTNFTPIVDMRYTTMAGFAMDTMKFHTLTVIIGARFEHFGPWTDLKNNGLATFSDSLYNTQCSGYTRNCQSSGDPGITWYSQKTGVSNSVNSP